MKEFGGVFSGLRQFYFWMQQNVSVSIPLMFSFLVRMDHVKPMLFTVAGSVTD